MAGFVTQLQGEAGRIARFRVSLLYIQQGQMNKNPAAPDTDAAEGSFL